MIKDIYGEVLKHGQKIVINSGMLKGYEYTLEHYFQPNKDSDLHIDMWGLVEYDNNGERVKCKIAEYFNGKVEKIKEVVLTSNNFTCIIEFVFTWCCPCGETNKSTIKAIKTEQIIDCNYCDFAMNITVGN